MDSRNSPHGAQRTNKNVAPPEPVANIPAPQDPGTAGAGVNSGVSLLSGAEIAALKRAHPILETLAACGVEVFGHGNHRVARCPFHEDQTPSLGVYCDTDRFYCFACGATGDTITFIQRFYRVSFREAIERLQSGRPMGGASAAATTPTAPSATPLAAQAPIAGTLARARRSTGRDDVTTEHQTDDPRVHAHDSDGEMSGLLTATVALYQQALEENAEAQAYLRERGVSMALAHQEHLGFADGQALGRFLAADPQAQALARMAGLLDAQGRERLAGRIIIPEMRAGRCLWMVGRLVEPASSASSAQDAAQPVTAERQRQTASEEAETPRYLGVVGAKPLLGVGLASAQTRSRIRRSPNAGVLIVEGPFDWLAALAWRLPVTCVALVGVYATERQRAELLAIADGRPIWIALDNDAAGDVGAKRLATQLTARGDEPVRVRRLTLPLGVKDLGALASLTDARQRALARQRLVEQLTEVDVSLSHAPSPESRETKS
jgi:DNA primase